MAFPKKRSEIEILKRLKVLKMNIDLIRNSEGYNEILETINILESFKDKSCEEICQEISKNKSNKNKTLKWMVSLYE